ncbi:MAG: outer membrane lipoprotein LolB [Rubrivivax sp.]
MFWTAVAAVAAVALVGCATPMAGVDTGPVHSGRLSIQVDAIPGRAEQRFTAAFDLVGTAEQGRLQLNSPLGITVASAQWSAGEARLTTAEGERRFPDLDSLSREALGESLPLRALPDWLSARPWPAAPSQPLPSNAIGFEQLDWHVDLSRYAQGFVRAERRKPSLVVLQVRLDAQP